MKQADLARRIGVAQSAISRWKRGESMPEPSNCRELARVFGVPEAEVLRRAGHLTGSGTLYEQQPEPSLEELLATALRKAREQPEYVSIPITGEGHAGRKGVSNDDVVTAPLKFLKKLPANQQALYVVGDCLAPKIEEGDVVIVDPDIPWEVGKTIAIRLRGGVEVKRILRKNGRLVLSSNYGEPTIDDHDARVVGVVIMIQKTI